MTRTRRGRWAFLVAMTLIVSACGGSDELAGFVRSPTPVVSDAALPDVSRGGEDFEFRAQEDGVLLVYFGYTSCPDVCPTTLADIRVALENVGNRAERVDVAMATIDPDRDTEPVITGYVQSFVDDAHALRTDDDALLSAAAEAFGVTYDVTTNDEGEIEVIHSGNLYAVNDQGELLVTWPFGVTIDDLESDIGILLRNA